MKKYLSIQDMLSFRIHSSTEIHALQAYDVITLLYMFQGGRVKQNKIIYEWNGNKYSNVNISKTYSKSFWALSNISLYIWKLISIYLNRKNFPIEFSTHLGLCFL